MEIKKSVSLLLATVLLLSLLPMAVVARPAEVSLIGPRVEGVMRRSASEGPELAAGNHASYLDRVANFPKELVEYYRWMENNANASGVLADPTKGSNYYGEYYHTVYAFTGTEQFTFTSKAEMLETAGQIASNALQNEFAAFSNYVGAIHDVFDREHPEVFWLSGQHSVSYMGSWSYSTRGDVCTVKYNADMVVWLQYPGYDIRSSRYLDPQTIADTIKVRDDTIAEILNGCPNGSVYDQVLYLNDTLTQRNAYNWAVVSGYDDYADPDAWECISALVGSSGTAGPVCEGYSRAFQTLCRKLSIPCVTVNGNAINEKGDKPESHMWNYVQIDGGWYAVDVTWNDPYIASNPEVKKSGKENHDWLLLGSDSPVAKNLNFLESHAVTNQVRGNGPAYTNGPVLERQAYEPKTVELFDISGTVTSTGTEELTVELWQNDTLRTSKTLSGAKDAYTFEGLEAGTYQLVVAKTGHVTRTETVVLSDGSLVCDVKIHKQGDVSGDGRINVGDVAKIYGYIRKTSVIIDPYILLCIDVTGDGRLNVGDTARLYGVVRGK